MKKITILIVSMLLSLFLLPSLRAEDDNKVIVIKPASSTETICPNRAPAYIPISAFYDRFMGTIVVSFSRNIGLIETTITNMNTGETVEGEIDAYEAPIFIPISNTNGVYYINFILSSGTRYIGSFEL